MIRAKQCSRCKLTKAAYCYWSRIKGSTILQSQCKDCHRILAREEARRNYQSKRAEQDRARKRERYRTDPAYRARCNAASLATKRRMRACAREEAA